MKLYPFPEKKGWKLGFGLFFLAILILSRDTLLTANRIGFVKSQVITAVLFLGLGILFLTYQRKHLGEIFRDSRLLLLLTAAVLLLIPMIVKQDWQLMYFSILFYIAANVLLSYFMSLEKISRYYLVILTVLGAYSVLCTYVLRILPDRGLVELPMLINPIKVHFYDFGLAQVSVEVVKNRNFGIFREPGVYQFFLLLGLFLNNYTANWDKNWKTWTVNIILAVTMLSTFATGGVLEMGLLAVFLFFDKKWYKKRTARIIAAVLVLGMIAVAAWLVITENPLYLELSWMLSKFGDDASGLSRYAAIAIDLDIFLHHPIFGDTVGNVLHAVESNATSTMVMYAFLGILGGSFHVAAWAALVWDRKRSILGNLILMVILFMSFNTQNLSWNLIFWTFPVIALAERGLPLMKSMRKKRA